MKRLILIQNDYLGAGKSTLAECLHQYLGNLRVPHHRFLLSDQAENTDSVPCLETSDLRLQALISHLDQSDLVLMEIANGATEAFHNFYHKHELENVLPELGFDVTVAIPVTSDRESFAGVTEAAEIYSDCAQYLIVHTPTGSSYDEDEHFWERSRAARVMDMFEAVDLKMPACHEALDFKLNHQHEDLTEALAHRESLPEDLREEITKWMRSVTGHLNNVRTYLFGDAFRPAIRIGPTPAATRRPRKPKTAVAAPAPVVAATSIAPVAIEESVAA
jgi:hypothetical protein